MVDYAISYTVTVLSGAADHRRLSEGDGSNFGGTGFSSMSARSHYNQYRRANHDPRGVPSREASGDSVTFAHQTTIQITKDLFLFGGGAGVTVFCHRSGLLDGSGRARDSRASLNGSAGNRPERPVHVARLFKRTSVA